MKNHLIIFQVQFDGFLEGTLSSLSVLGTFLVFMTTSGIFTGTLNGFSTITIASLSTLGKHLSPVKPLFW